MKTIDDFDDNMLVDFSDYVEPVIKKNLYDKDYNKTTTKFYRSLRESQLDVIMQDNTGFDPEKSFKFMYKWDPYTGETTGEDPYGPLYFHPDNLIFYFYMKRLNMLWQDQEDENENGGMYQGYYGEAVGAGDDLNIISRGMYPERYLFRLPITNCYLEKDSDMSIITMGPRLTNKDVELIDYIAETSYKNNYKERYGKRRPNLRLMKSLYDQAISKTPDLTKLKGYNPNKKYTEAELVNFRNKANRVAVDMLKSM